MERYFYLPVRVGYPTDLIGLKEKVHDTAYATAVGLIKLAHKSFTFDKREVISKGQEKEKENSSLLHNVMDRIKAFFKDIM